MIFMFDGQATNGVFQLKRSAFTQPPVVPYDAPLFVDLRSPLLSQQYCHSDRIVPEPGGFTRHWKPSPPRISPQPNAPVSVFDVPLSCAPPRILPTFAASTVPA